MIAAIGLDGEVAARERCRPYLEGHRGRAALSLGVLGEVLQRILQVGGERGHHAFGRLVEYYRKGLIEFYAAGRRQDGSLGLANELLEEDHLLEPADALNVACAFADPKCGTFVTSDGALLNSQTLREAARARQKTVREAVDAPRGRARSPGRPRGQR